MQRLETSSAVNFIGYYLTNNRGVEEKGESKSLIILTLPSLKFAHCDTLVLLIENKVKLV